MQNIKIPRYIGPEKFTSEWKHSVYISELAYGVCVYLVTIDAEGHKDSHLITAKGRVAPLKSISIPRLELTGAALAATTIDQVEEMLEMKRSSFILATDSKNVIDWTSMHSRKLDTFTANRVGLIQTETATMSIMWVPTLMNPADIISRGSGVMDLAKNDLWWKGPDFITDESKFPEQPTKSKEVDDSPIMMCHLKSTETTSPIYNFTTWKSLLAFTRRILSWMKSAIEYKHPELKRYTANQLALNKIFKAIQTDGFPEQYKILEANGELPFNDKLKHLAATMSEE